MPLKNIVSGQSGAPLKSGRQRTLTNKQQQLRKRSSSLQIVAILISFGVLVAQKNEKEGTAKQRALTDAIRAEQRNEEMNGFYKAKRPGNT
jgi:hypothetical protein